MLFFRNCKNVIWHWYTGLNISQGLKRLQKGFYPNAWPSNFLDKYGYHCFIIIELFDMNRIGRLAYINVLDSIIMDAFYLFPTYGFIWSGSRRS